MMKKGLLLLLALLLCQAAAMGMEDSFSITVTVSSVTSPTISSPYDQIFARNDLPAGIPPITITEHNSAASIKTVHGIRIKIPDAFPAVWDGSVTAPGLSGSAAPKVSPLASYPDDKTLFLNVIEDFAPADTLVISGLMFRDFTERGSAETLALFIEGALGPIAARDDRYKAIGAPMISSEADQVFIVGYPAYTVKPITVREDPKYPVIRPSGSLRIKIPPVAYMQWDSSASSPVISGPAAGRTGAVSYENLDKIFVLEVLSTFEADEHITISGLVSRNIFAEFPESHLELGVDASGTTTAADDRYIVGVPAASVEAAAVRDKKTGSTVFASSTEAELVLEVKSSVSIEAMQVSENADFSGATWSPYENPAQITLSSGDGQKKVHVRLRMSYDVISAPSSASTTLDTLPPEIKDIAAQGKNLVSGDAISEKPLFSAVVSDANGISLASIVFAINGVPVTDGTGFNNHYDSYNETTGRVAYTPKQPLAAGEYSLSVGASDRAGNRTEKETERLEVHAGEPAMIGQPLVYPNPANPDKGPVTLGYQLSRDARVEVFLYDATLRLVWQKTFQAGEEGGMAGYNEVAWDGMTSYGRMIEPGAYLYRISVEIGGKRTVIGSGRLAIIR